MSLIAKDVNKAVTDNDKALARINEKLSIISEETERMLRLINELLESTKPGLGSRGWTAESVRVCDVIDKAQKSLQGRLGEKPGVEIEFIHPDECPEVMANYDKLMRVFINVLDNAVKFTSEGTIQVRLENQKDEAIMVTVKDSGCGIEPNRLPLIFEQYHSTDTVNKISGLGLPICKQIIEHYKGSIEVDSEVGVGTTFMVRLPV